MAGEGRVTRRLLLTAGGLTLLAGCSTSVQSRGGARAKALTRGPDGPLPNTEPATAGEPAAMQDFGGDQGPATTHPVLTRPARPARTANPRSVAGSGRPMFYIDDGPHAIALTIDDGPDPTYTPQILALLARHNVIASFSMIGISVQQYPAIARDVAAAGHVITNHTWQHLDLPALPVAAACFQMDRATAAIQRATDQTPAFFRAPFGSWSPAVLEHCAHTGMTPVDWSVDPRDWAQPGVRCIVENILRNTRTGSIILEHDGGGSRAQTVAALRIVIPRLLDAGYQFYPV